MNMNMKALTFLGLSKYTEVTYVWRGRDGTEKAYKTHLFPEAVAQIFKPRDVVVFVTPEVEKSDNFKDLSSRIGDRLRCVRIPEGKSEQELWSIFEQVEKVVDEKDTLILDITHAFRSLPLLVFTASAYLRRKKRARVKHIVYGAFEARDENGRAPVFDLTPLLDLVDWLSGVEFFLRKGDAELLAEKLEEAEKRAWGMGGDGMPRRLKEVGEKLKELSEAFYLARPRDVMRVAYEVLPLLEELEEEIQQWAKPFAGVVDQVRARAKELAHERYDVLDEEALRRQLALIEQLGSNRLWMQAVLLAREWMINWGMLCLRRENWLDRRERKDVERALKKWEDTNTRQAWRELSKFRHDLAHCGMHRNAKNVAEIQRRGQELWKGLKRLLGMEDG